MGASADSLGRAADGARGAPGGVPPLDHPSERASAPPPPPPSLLLLCLFLSSSPARPTDPLPPPTQRVSEPCLPVNLSASRSGTFDPSVARRALTWGRGATPLNAARIEAYAQRAELEGDFGPPFAPCEVVHPWMESCVWNGVDRWHHVFRCVGALSLSLSDGA